MKFIVFLIAVLYLVGCNVQNDKNIKLTYHDEKIIEMDQKEPLQGIIKLPDQVVLTFNGIGMEKLEEKESHPSWKRLDSLNLGQVNGKSITVDLYDSNDMFNYMNGVLFYNEKTYPIHVLGYAHNKIVTYPLRDTFQINNEVYHLIGVIGTEGVLADSYIFYNETKEEMLVYRAWGKPKLADLNNDGVNEILIQFPGKHLHFKNLSIMRVGTYGFEVANLSEGISEHLDDKYKPIKVASTYQLSNNKFKVDVFIMSFSDPYMHLEGKEKYNLNNFKLHIMQ